MKRKLLAALAALPFAANAYLADELADLVGWEVAWSGRITGFQDENGKRSDDYEGCEHGRKLILDDRFTVTCTSYHYSYAYNPRAVLLRNGSSMKLVVQDKLFTVSR